MSSQAASSPKKVPNRVEKSQRRLFFNYFDSFSTPFWTFLGLEAGPRGPGIHFPTLFATLGPKGPNDPCSRPRGVLTCEVMMSEMLLLREVCWP